VLEVLLSLAYLASGVPKLTGANASVKQRDHHRLPPWFWRSTGLLETVGALGLLVGLWIHPLAIAAAVLLALVMLGAIITHLRSRDPATHAAVPLVLLVLLLLLLGMAAASA
jgi:uncharacterized membrane protein YphA (DoxX/SURF4 family)